MTTIYYYSVVSVLFFNLSFTHGFQLLPFRSINAITRDHTPVLRLAQRDFMDVATTSDVTLQSLRETLCGLRADLRTCETAAVGIEPDTPTSIKAVGDRNLSLDEFGREKVLSTRIPKLALHRTHLGPSLIPGAGRGLFAKHAISKGDLITCYPGDAILYTPPNSDEKYDEEEDMDDISIWDDDIENEEEEGADEIVIWGEHVEEADRWEEDAVFEGSIEEERPHGKRPLTDYAVEVCDLYTVLALPALDTDPAYFGHFANDGAGHFAEGGTGIGGDMISAYVLESIRLSNARHVPLEESHMVTIATRDIAEGEEILVMYGPDYWMEHSNF